MKKFRFFSIILLSCMSASTISAETNDKGLPFAKISLTNNQLADSLTHNAYCFNAPSQLIKDEFIRASNQYDIAVWQYNTLSWDNMVYILKNAKKVKPDGRKLQNGHINPDGTFGYKPYVPDANDSVYEYMGRYICKVDCCNRLIDESGSTGGIPPVSAVDRNAGVDPRVTQASQPGLYGNNVQADSANCCGGVYINGDNNSVNVGGTPAGMQGAGVAMYGYPMTNFVQYPQYQYSYPMAVPQPVYYPYNGQQYYYSGGVWRSTLGVIITSVVLIAILDAMRTGNSYGSYGGNYYSPRPATGTGNTGNPVNPSPGTGSPVNPHN